MFSVLPGSLAEDAPTHDALTIAVTPPPFQAPSTALGVSSTPDRFCHTLGNPDSDFYRDEESPLDRRVWYFSFYFAVSLGLSFTCSAASVGLWSEIGCGPNCLQALKAHEFEGIACLVASLFAFFGLYVLDAFNPPYLPGQKLALWDGDRVVGRLILLLGVALFCMFCVLIAGEYPVVPLILSVFLGPVSVLTFRWFVKHSDSSIAEFKEPSLWDESDRNHSDLSMVDTRSADGFESRMYELRRITGGQRDQKDFYSAAALAFGIVGLFCAVVFIVWAGESEFEFDRALVEREKELLFIRYAAPLGVAVSDLMFALLMGLRVALHRTYVGSCEVRSRLVVETAARALGKEIVRHRVTALAHAQGTTSRVHSPHSSFAVSAAGAAAAAAAEVAAAAKASATPASVGLPAVPSLTTQQSWADMRQKIDEYLKEQCTSTQRLTNVIKILNAAFVVLLGALFVTFQFTATDSHFAMLAQAFAAAMLATFVLYTMLAFTHLWRKLRVWLQDLPIWSSVASAVTQDWFRSFAVLFLFPALPVIVVLSWTNQFVRNYRGGRIQECDDGGLEPRPFPMLTEHVAVALDGLRRWNWLGILQWCYFWSVALMMYKLTPIGLNVTLAWMRAFMSDLHFGVILLATFLAGMVLFMLPPVPGPPIYLFGGFVISDKCPWGFWCGTVICIALCFVLKLTACAVQQKIIGGYLSTKLWVRQLCAVHTPFMRAIERVLQKPGFSFGKVMILCGGPDWPTSVLAGILGISVFQCELGTCPIVATVTPLVLSGSFYLRNGHGEIWARLGNFMFILTGVVSMAFWAGMAWAIQEEFDKNNHLITVVREEFVDLEWLDYRSAEIAKRCKVRWKDIPRYIRAWLISGMVCETAVALLFFWRSSWCFGVFAVDADIESLEWFGEGGLIRPMGSLGLLAAVVGCSGIVVFRLWILGHTRLPRREAACELDLAEEEWKAARRREAQAAEMQRRASPKPSASLEALTENQVTQLSSLIFEITAETEAEMINDKYTEQALVRAKVSLASATRVAADIEELTKSASTKDVHPSCTSTDSASNARALAILGCSESSGIRPCVEGNECKEGGADGGEESQEAKILLLPPLDPAKLPEEEPSTLEAEDPPCEDRNEQEDDAISDVDEHDCDKSVEAVSESEEVPPIKFKSVRDSSLAKQVKGAVGAPAAVISFGLQSSPPSSGVHVPELLQMTSFSTQSEGEFRVDPLTMSGRSWPPPLAESPSWQPQEQNELQLPDLT